MRLAILFVLLLNGCALPPSLSLATYLADGAVYLVTGKGSGDHGLSALTGEDCRMWRVIDGQAICLPEPVLVSTAPKNGATVGTTHN
jgi:hypothetical protein